MESGCVKGEAKRYVDGDMLHSVGGGGSDMAA